jgi:hypothetical protein
MLLLILIWVLNSPEEMTWKPWDMYSFTSLEAHFLGKAWESPSLGRSIRRLRRRRSRLALRSSAKTFLHSLLTIWERPESCSLPRNQTTISTSRCLLIWWIKRDSETTLFSTGLKEDFSDLINKLLLELSF